MLSMKPDVGRDTWAGCLATPYGLRSALEHDHVPASRQMPVHGRLDVLRGAEVTLGP